MPKRPLLVGVAELLNRPGERRQLTTSVLLDDLQLSSARVPEGDDVDVDLTIEAILGGVTVIGEVRARWQGECRRCLDPVNDELVVEVRELFSDNPTLDDPDVLKLEGTQIDLEPIVREAVMLALPLAPLCRDDCPGPAPEVTPVVAPTDEIASEEEDSEDRDHRWDALNDLRFE